MPAELKEIYRTSFQLSPYAFLHVAARAQKWIDQAISRNIYLQSRDVGEMVDLYAAAWRMGVKTTYYLHMMPRHTAEQSTVKVNKARRRSPRRWRGRGAGTARPPRVRRQRRRDPSRRPLRPEIRTRAEVRRTGRPGRAAAGHGGRRGPE